MSETFCCYTAAEDPAERTCCFTGHRELSEPLFLIRRRLRRELRKLLELGVTDFCAGGALGFDTLAAEEVLRLRRRRPSVRLFLLLPCRDQAAHWGAEAVRRYEQIKAEADGVEYLCERYQRGCMQRRNRALVDRSRFCICYLSERSGGTKYTVDYAKSRGLSILNLAGRP